MQSRRNGIVGLINQAGGQSVKQV